MYILGISSFYHDSAAALLKDGEIIAAAEEERFTRVKHDKSFPRHSIAFCLEMAGVSISQIDYIVFYDKPFVKFERILESHLWDSPRSVRSFVAAMREWLHGGKLLLSKTLRQEFIKITKEGENRIPPILFSNHHRSHAASAFYPSPFKEAAVLCIDGVGEWATTSCWKGSGSQLELIWQINFPHSLGLLYSAFTYYLGFEVNDGEYKLMGLAAYGNPEYTTLIKEYLIDIKEDGTFRLNMEYFNFTKNLTMTNDRFDQVFGAPPRKPTDPLTQREKNIAKSIQLVCEEIIIKLAETIKKESGADNLCLAGGVALNCVANGKIIEKEIFKRVWIQPASGDSGGALGAAYAVWYQHCQKDRNIDSEDKMKGALLGPSYSNDQVKSYLDSIGAVYKFFTEENLVKEVAKYIDGGSVVAWFQGRMEYGPRALGARSILGDARASDMQKLMNLKIKYRESFRPFAPAVLEEHASDFFSLTCKSPYMLIAAQVNQSQIGKVPAVTHVDNSARIQTVSKSWGSRFYELINAFKERTGCALIINTSFNIRGEPIVCSPVDAYRCFMNTEIDYLVLENFILKKCDQALSSRETYTTPELSRPSRGKIIPENFFQNYEIANIELRKFGIKMAIMFPAVFYFLLPWIWGREQLIWPWIVSLSLTVLSFAALGSLRWFYRFWMNLGRVLGAFKSIIFWGLMYYIFIVPYAFSLKIFIKNFKASLWEKDLLSYRLPPSRDGQFERLF